MSDSPAEYLEKVLNVIKHDGEKLIKKLQTIKPSDRDFQTKLSLLMFEARNLHILSQYKNENGFDENQKKLVEDFLIDLDGTYATCIDQESKLNSLNYPVLREYFKQTFGLLSTERINDQMKNLK